MMTLDELIDEIGKSGRWGAIKVFFREDGTSFVSMQRSNLNSFVSDQCTRPDAPASERLREMLEAQLDAAPVYKPVAPPKKAKAAPTNDFEDLLG